MHLRKLSLLLGFPGYIKRGIILVCHTLGMTSSPFELHGGLNGEI